LPGDPLKKPIILRHHKLPTVRGIRRFLKNGDLSEVLDYKPLMPNPQVKEVLREHRAMLSAVVAHRHAVLNSLNSSLAQRLLEEIDPKTGKKRHTQREVAGMLKITQAKLQRQLLDLQNYHIARRDFLKKRRSDSR